ncbi:hypothetical protein OH786_35450 (plasmid) [Streptomyces atratus]|uniref:Uncharacterized protein n=2 Tax=Streptomyces atratus TaxID=1893 RepID=A0A1K1ZPQ2_STRAR|nr:hypothetical protein [Streptomyces atratus]SFX76137.1 hypothetical protein SAMN02787144_100635 [Streptomyces atratus]
MIGIEAAGDDERPVKRTQDDMWAVDLAAARQFRDREGYLRVPRKHVEHLEGVAEGTTNPSGRQTGTDGIVVVKLGTWLDNTRTLRISHRARTTEAICALSEVQPDSARSSSVAGQWPRGGEGRLDH